MRVGDFSVDVVAHGGGRVRELASGHVLARPGQVYRLRLRNHGPLFGVVQLTLDGRTVTAGGLVLAPWSTTDLERPIDAQEDGRFTVMPEGDENAFGADGGRDNESLGVIEARCRRELPNRNSFTEAPTIHVPRTQPVRPLPSGPSEPQGPPRRMPGEIHALRGFDAPPIERAAGTGLTGHSEQQFEYAHLGPLEKEETVIRLRLVIGSEAAIAEEPRPSDQTGQDAPARPAARP